MSTLHAWFDERLGRTPSRNAERPETRYGLGALSALLFLLIALSGLYMAMFFSPSPTEAWKSIQFMEDNIAFGGLARALHCWGAFVLLICMIFHILSCVFRGAYRAPRELNWVLGIMLMLLTLAFIFTGYLILWDFRSYWIVQTVTNWFEDLPLFSGALGWLFYTDAPNGVVPVGRWFAIHAVALPLLTVLILTGHTFLFRRHGSTVPKK